jgi:hypothetical protein
MPWGWLHEPGDDDPGDVNVSGASTSPHLRSESNARRRLRNVMWSPYRDLDTISSQPMSRRLEVIRPNRPVVDDAEVPELRSQCADRVVSSSDPGEAQRTEQAHR